MFDAMEQVQSRLGGLKKALAIAGQRREAAQGAARTMTLSMVRIQGAIEELELLQKHAAEAEAAETAGDRTAEDGSLEDPDGKIRDLSAEDGGQKTED